MTGHIHLICGKICSGKSWYARRLQQETRAVILSTDELTWDLIRNEQGDFYNVFAARANLFLRKKAAEIAAAGANVILDWGFWTKENRQEISDYLRERNISFTWHYIDVPDDIWLRHIAERNARVQAGEGGSDFYVDEGLKAKLQRMFQVPDPDEIDVWHHVTE